MLFSDISMQLKSNSIHIFKIQKTKCFIDNRLFTLISDKHTYIRNSIDWKFNKDKHTSRNKSCHKEKAHWILMFLKYHLQILLFAILLSAKFIKFYHLPIDLLYRYRFKGLSLPLSLIALSSFHYYFHFYFTRNIWKNI